MTNLVFVDEFKEVKQIVRIFECVINKNLKKKKTCCLFLCSLTELKSSVIEELTIKN